MDVRQLRCFVAVAEELHFGRAAGRLHVAQPAVSQTVKALERELGVALFDRTNRRVALTAAGEVLLGEARAVLARLDAAGEVMARVRAGDTGRVVVGAVPALPPELVPRLLRRFRSELPSVEVHVRALPDRVSGPDALDRLGFDLVLVRGEVDLSGVRSVRVAREPVGVALPEGHELAVMDRIAPRDLSGQPFAAFSRAADPEEYERIFGALSAAGFQGATVVHEASPGAVDSSLRLVASGAAVSLKLASEVHAFGHPGIVWRPLEGVTIEVVVSAAWSEAPASPAVRRLADLLTRAG